MSIWIESPQSREIIENEEKLQVGMLSIVMKQ